MARLALFAAQWQSSFFAASARWIASVCEWKWEIFSCWRTSFNYQLRASDIETRTRAKTSDEVFSCCFIYWCVNKGRNKIVHELSYILYIYYKPFKWNWMKERCRLSWSRSPMVVVMEREAGAGWRTEYGPNKIIYARVLCNLANNNFGGQKLGLQL